MGNLKAPEGIVVSEKKAKRMGEGWNGSGCGNGDVLRGMPLMITICFWRIVQSRDLLFPCVPS